MSPVRVDRDVDRLAPSLLKLEDKCALFLRIKAEVGVDREDQDTVSGLTTSGEELAVVLGVSFPGCVIARPHVDDAQVGIGIEALYEFLSLVEHVTLKLVTDRVPRKGIALLNDIAPCATLDGVEVNVPSRRRRERETRSCVTQATAKHEEWVESRRSRLDKK